MCFEVIGEPGVRVAVCAGEGGGMAEACVQAVGRAALRCGRRAIVGVHPSAEGLAFSLDDTQSLPILVLVSLTSGDAGALAAVREARRLVPASAVIVVSDSDSHVFDALDSGASNYAVIDAAGTGERRLERMLCGYFASARGHGESRLRLGAPGEWSIIPLAEVSHVEVVGHDCTLRCAGGQAHTFGCRLTELEQALSPYGFVRVHRAFLANARHVRQISARECAMAGGEVLPVGRQYADEARRYVRDYKGSNVSVTWVPESSE